MKCNWSYSSDCPKSCGQLEILLACQSVASHKGQQICPNFVCKIPSQLHSKMFLKTFEFMTYQQGTNIKRDFQNSLCHCSITKCSIKKYCSIKVLFPPLKMKSLFLLHLFAIFTYHLNHEQKLSPVQQPPEASVQWKQPWYFRSLSETWFLSSSWVERWTDQVCSWLSGCDVAALATALFVPVLVGMFTLVGIFTHSTCAFHIPASRVKNISEADGPIFYLFWWIFGQKPDSHE